VFIRTAKIKDKYPAERRRLDGVNTLFVGGDTRYGLGRLRRVAFNQVKQGGPFGSEVNLDAEDPEVALSTVWAHAHGLASHAHGRVSLSGALELLGGWDHRSIRRLDQALPLWQPGSCATAPIRWSIGTDGLWGAVL